MNLNDWDLEYPEEEKNGHSALANIVEKCAASEVGKEELMEWFEAHKVPIK